jgi:hypothetical protein
MGLNNRGVHCSLKNTQFVTTVNPNSLKETFQFLSRKTQMKFIFSKKFTQNKASILLYYL